MRIQLIHPPAHINATALTALRPSAPLGLAYLAASLRKAGHEIVLLDCLAEAIDQQVPGNHAFQEAEAEDHKSHLRSWNLSPTLNAHP